MSVMRRDEWTIMFEDDGPAFAVEGHDIAAYPELDRVEVVPASQLQGAVEDRDALRVMLKRLLDVALVDGYGETVRDEAEALLTATGGQ